MGCDIHAAIEYRKGDKWEALVIPNKYYGKWDNAPEFTSELPINRNYDAFAILANVRNGVGFAGVQTGSGFTYISDNRGLPEDISEAGLDSCNGDHSDTYVTLAEILAFDWTQKASKRGIWEDSYTKLSGDLWDTWIPVMLKLGNEHGVDNVRMVMNFDS